jgi:hypothetical protein
MECSHGLAYFEYQGRLVSPTRVAKAHLDSSNF